MTSNIHHESKSFLFVCDVADFSFISNGIEFLLSKRMVQGGDKILLISFYAS